MTNEVLLDNDIILKASCYSAALEVISCVSEIGLATVLPVARYVLLSTIKRFKRIINKDGALANLSELLNAVKSTEPQLHEIELAAELEATAQAYAVALDPGESQLVAILLSRTSPLMITGDKRAIGAIDTIMSARRNPQANGRIACLEQLVMHLLRTVDPRDLRCKICREAAIDKALAITFSCSADSFSPEIAVEGLTSYINALRKMATAILVTSLDLSAVIA